MGTTSLLLSDFYKLVPWHASRVKAKETTLINGGPKFQLLNDLCVLTPQKRRPLPLLLQVPFQLKYRVILPEYGPISRDVVTERMNVSPAGTGSVVVISYGLATRPILSQRAMHNERRAEAAVKK